MTPAISTNAEAAALALAAADPVLGDLIRRIGPCELKADRRVDLFDALLRSIIYQQLHGKAAAAIHSRVLALLPRKKATAPTFARLTDESLRTAGLSANKLRAIRDLAQKTLDGTIPSPRLVESLDDDELIARLTEVRGIGAWTVHMLMIFHLGRSDVMPTGDFAIRKAFSQHYRKGKSITPEAIIRHAKRWQPHRSIASWYLWRSLDLD